MRSVCVKFQGCNGQLIQARLTSHDGALSDEPSYPLPEPLLNCVMGAVRADKQQRGEGGLVCTLVVY